MEIDENTLKELQNYQQQLTNILSQKEMFKLQLLESEKALGELKKTSERECFVVIGNVFIKKSVEEVKKQLEEEIEILNIKIKSLENSEGKIREKLKELERKLKS